MGWNEAVGALLNLIQFSKSLIKVLVKLISAVPKLLSLFMIFTNPSKVLKDTIHGITIGIKMILSAIIDGIFGNITKKFKPYVIGNDADKSKEECISPSYLEIMLLILCPPLAILVRKGLKAFLTILITAALTYTYYFPGVIFASLHIL